MEKFDIAIIGAGVIGSITARELSKYKLNVCVLEKEADLAMYASGANSGIVHAGFDAEPGSLKAKFNVLGNKMIKKVAEELGVKYIQNGSLVVAFDDEDIETLKTLYQRGIKNGVENLKLLNREEALELEPALCNNIKGALYAPTAGIICPYGLNIAAMGNAMDNGVSLKYNFEVKRIEKSENYILFSDTESIEAKYVINCAGVNSGKIAALAGDHSITIIPRKGEYMLLDKACGKIVSTTVFKTPTKMGKGILVTPTVDGNLLLGPTSVDIDDSEDKTTTSDSLAEIASQALFRVPEINLRNVITSFSGIRATGNTGDFIITMPKENFLNIAGIESPGLTSAPAIAQYVCKLLKESGLTLEEKEDFNPTRRPLDFFENLTDEEKNSLITEYPLYGKIVCRCEKITEGEIVDAIHSNPPTCTVDGVKRRTRAGMGRCSGGFCMPSVAEIISRETKIPFEQITKFGRNSYINLNKTK